MNGLLEPHFSWTFFLGVLLLLSTIYMLLKFVNKQLHYLPLGQQSKEQFVNFSRKTLLLFELIVGVFGGSVFVLLNPIWHGLLVLFLVTVCFGLIRNYIIGILLCFDNGFQIEKQIVINGKKGIINKMNGLGIYIHLHEGIQYYNYSYLQENGFSLIKGDDIDEFCFINISNKEENNTKIKIPQFLQKLMFVPYLDSAYQPTIIEGASDDYNLQIRILLRCGSHQKELVDLMDEWGYLCKLTY